MALHTAKEKLRKEHQKEQEQNVQYKKVLAEIFKADPPGATGEVADDNDGSSRC